jgi:hypothetical protein
MCVSDRMGQHHCFNAATVRPCSLKQCIFYVALFDYHGEIPPVNFANLD